MYQTHLFGEVELRSSGVKCGVELRSEALPNRPMILTLGEIFLATRLIAYG